MDFFLKHGAKSSSSKSPWQPVSAATFFLTESGSRWSAHGDRAEPLIKIARCIKSGKVTNWETNCYTNWSKVLVLGHKLNLQNEKVLSQKCRRITTDIVTILDSAKLLSGFLISQRQKIFWKHCQVNLHLAVAGKLQYFSSCSRDEENCMEIEFIMLEISFFGHIQNSQITLYMALL